MGLTHFAILNQLFNNANFTFVDPDKKISFFAKKNLSAQIVDSDNRLNQNFNHALICTPPMFHISVLKKCLSMGVPNIFVEKPFGGVYDDFSALDNATSRIGVGYVLRFNPIVQWVKENLDVSKIIRVEGSYNSNTIEKKPKGWRNSHYSGVTNELGSHVIDLCVYLFGLSNPIITKRQIFSVISDVDDIVSSELESNQILYNFSFNWVNKDYRKPVFRINILFNDNTIWSFDQQKIEIIENEEVVKRFSAVDLSSKVPFYLRGVDFTLQMQDFITDCKHLASLKDALIVRDVIKSIFSK